MKLLVRNLARNTSEAAPLEMYEALLMDLKAGTSRCNPPAK